MTATYLVNHTRNLMIAAAAATLTVAAIATVPTPASAETMSVTTPALWQANVERQIDNNLQMPTNALRTHTHALAQVRVAFDADGHKTGATIAQSSGDAAIDREALRTANVVDYPLLPAALRHATPTSVLMQVYFADNMSSEYLNTVATLQTVAHRSVDTLRIQTAQFANK